MASSMCKGKIKNGEDNLSLDRLNTLIAANRNIDITAVRKILEQGAIDEYSTCLSLAIDIKAAESVELLLKSGSKPGPEDLCRAASTNGRIGKRVNMRIIEHLLEYGADPYDRVDHYRRGGIISGNNFQIMRDVCFLDHAIGARLFDLTRLLLNHDLNKSKLESNLDVSLKAAISLGDLDSLRFLLTSDSSLSSHCIDMELCGHFGTPLIAAVRLRHINMVELLLTLGADVNYLWLDYNAFDAVIDTYPLGRKGLNRSAPTALMQACFFRDLAMVLKLLSHGSDVNIIEKELGLTALIICFEKTNIAEQHIDIIKKLLENGAYFHNYVTFSAALGPASSLIVHALRNGLGVRDPCALLLRGACLLLTAGSRPPPGIVEETFTTIQLKTTHFKANGAPCMGFYKGVFEFVKACVMYSLVGRDVMARSRHFFEESEGHRNLLDFLDTFLTDGLTLKALCRIKLRTLIKEPLMVNVKSETIELPASLKEYLVNFDL